MTNELLINLLDEYKTMLVAEKEYRESERMKRFSEYVNNFEEWKNRPSKAELKRVGIMLREKSIQAEKEQDRNYWG